MCQRNRNHMFSYSLPNMIYNQDTGCMSSTTLIYTYYITTATNPIQQEYSTRCEEQKHIAKDHNPQKKQNKTKQNKTKKKTYLR